MFEGLKKQHTQPTPYSFEVIKIELFDESNSPISTPNHPNSQGGLIIRVANIIQNIENSSKFHLY